MTTRTPFSTTAVRWILAPLLAFAALSAWAVASPVGAAPDDDYHLVSIWCANGGSDYCKPGVDANERLVDSGFGTITCFAQSEDKSAACQSDLRRAFGSAVESTERGNFAGEYPPLYYATMRLIAGPDVEASAITIRMINVALFVGLATVLAWLVAPARRRTLLWMWLVTTVPLGMFVVASNNPSSWAVMGVGTAFVALLGWFESEGRRRWALGAAYLCGVLLASGARGDAAVYAIGATLAVLIITAARSRSWFVAASLPAIGLVIAGVLFLMAGQAGVAGAGFTSDGPDSAPDGSSAPSGGIALVAYNLLMLPFLWTGVWGSWALGWLDTMLPAVVVWSAASAFIVVAFAGLGQMTLRKAITVAGVLAVLIVLPVYVLTAGGDAVGENLQPRYLLPLIVLFAGVLLTEPHGRALSFTRVQTVAVLGALAIANAVALQVNIRRYVTGADDQGVNLDAGAEWWWSGLPVGPMVVWIGGTLAFAALLAGLWPALRDETRADARPIGSRT